MRSKTERVLVLPDIHVRAEKNKVVGVDLLSWKAVMQYASKYTWDEVIQLGDFLDFNCISSHNKNQLRLTKDQSIQADYAAANLLLDEIQTACPGAKLTILEGNHDYRIERYIDEHPEAEGLLEVEVGLRLRERGINWVRSWSKGEIYTKGKASFTHGLYTPEHHSKKHVSNYGTNIFYGHLHDFQQYSKVLIGDNSTLVGQSLGCLCDYRQYYMKGRPNRWQQGFAVFHFHPGDGYFNYYPVMIFKNRFTSPEGDTYDGKRK